MGNINPTIVKWFEGRGISEGTLLDMQIYSGRRQATGDGFKIEPDITGEIIVFPYMEKGVAVNDKFRERGKKFYQRPGGKKVFYNSDILDDPQLAEGRASLVIVEGEPDLLTVKECGNPFVVSVPDGAPPAFGSIVSAEDFDPAHDTKYGYILNDWERLKPIKRIVIATDNDPPGKRLAEELVRRLGRDRCSFVTYPEGCKDFNEVALKHGPAVVAEMIARATPYPVSGVYTYENLPPEPPIVPVSTGFFRLDEYIKLFYPSFVVVTGFAGSGKSSLVNQMVAQLALRAGWRCGIASFEMRINPFVTGVLRATYFEVNEGRRVTNESADAWLNDMFAFISPEPSEEDRTFDVDWLIEKAITAVVRYGIRVLVIDPWNEVEHAVRRGESLTDYTGRAIRALKRFAREFEVCVIVVAHPTKSAANKLPEEVSLYDVSDSAHFANKADFGMVVARLGGPDDYMSQIAIKKVRYQPVTGKPGATTLVYDSVKRIFSQ